MDMGEKATSSLSVPVAMFQPMPLQPESVTEPLRTHSKSVSIVLSYFLVLVFGFIGYLSGPTVSLSVLYVIPIILGTWNVGRANGIALAATSAAVWLAADLMWSLVYLHPAVPYWNAIMTFGLFLMVVLLVSQVRTANERLHRTVAEKTANLTAELAERKQVEGKLRKSYEQLHQFAVHLQSAREEERSRIAREIHDELGQALTGLKFDISWIGKKLPEGTEELQDKTRSTAKLIDGTIQMVRRISTELRPGVLDRLGLAAAIEWQVQEFQNRTGIRCTLSPNFEDMRLDRDRATAVFRILQEALTNVARHANATSVNVSLGLESGNLMLEVRDNGEGIPESALLDSKSLGLLGMKERALAFGGRVNIVGNPGNGTRVIMVIPSGLTEENGEST